MNYDEFVKILHDFSDEEITFKEFSEDILPIYINTSFTKKDIVVLYMMFNDSFQELLHIYKTIGYDNNEFDEAEKQAHEVLEFHKNMGFRY